MRRRLRLVLSMRANLGKGYVRYSPIRNEQGAKRFGGLEPQETAAKGSGRVFRQVLKHSTSSRRALRVTYKYA